MHLARAFIADPFLTYVLPDSERRERLLPKCFRCVLRLGFRHGEVYASGPDLEGVAVWLSPDASDTSFGTMLRASGLPLALSLGLAASWRLLSYFRKVGRLCQQHCTFPHWYLLTLGVVPEHQRQGVGSSLIRCKLTQLDVEQEAMPPGSGHRKTRMLLYATRISHPGNGRHLGPGSPLFPDGPIAAGGGPGGPAMSGPYDPPEGGTPTRRDPV